MSWTKLVALVALGACGGVAEQGDPGAQGSMGDPGPQGATGPAGQSVDITAEPAGTNCPHGGVKLESATGTSYVCNGGDAVAPTGAVVAFAGNMPPDGWLLCDGTAISRTTYADLFTVIGTAWGEGDAATTFNVPDMRGRFLRGTDHAAGRDPDAGGRIASASGGNIGDRVGTLEGDQFRAHSHSYAGAFTVDGGVVTGHIQGGSSTGFTVWGNPGTTSGAGGSESRPLNVGVNYIIKI
jgi:microcystin-dependent protein